MGVINEAIGGSRWSHVLQETAQTEVQKLSDHENKLIGHVDDR